MRRRGRDGVCPPGSVGITALGVLLGLALGAPGARAQSADAEVVARVQTATGEVRITGARLAAYAAHQPGRSTAELLDDLVTFEVLAAQAGAAGLAADPAVRAAENQALVRVYLGREFGPRFTDDKLPAHYVESAYTQNRGQFVHPELRTGAHVLVTTPASKRPTDPALDAEAQRYAEGIATRLRAEQLETGEQFAARVKQIADEAPTAGLPEGLVVRPESLGRFARSGPFVAAFSEAAFGQAVHEVGSPFPTDFGWHVVWIDTIEPAINRPLAEVSDEVRARIGPEVRQMEFRTLTDGLAKAGDAAVDTGPLEALARRLQAPAVAPAGDREGAPDGSPPSPR